MKCNKHTKFYKTKCENVLKDIPKNIALSQFASVKNYFKMGERIKKKIRTDALYYYKVLQAIFQLTTVFEGGSVAEWLEHRI